MAQLTRLPTLVCPRCKGALDYQVTIDMLDPPVGKVDTVYCSTCVLMFEHVQQTGTFYESTLWPPVCRLCRQPVSFEGVVEGRAGEARFQCRDHPGERWTWSRGEGRWARTA
jgi:uncharacterized protein YbaR (Trm112 family)